MLNSYLLAKIRSTSSEREVFEVKTVERIQTVLYERALAPTTLNGSWLFPE